MYAECVRAIRERSSVFRSEISFPPYFRRKMIERYACKRLQFLIGREKVENLSYEVSVMGSDIENGPGKYLSNDRTKRAGKGRNRRNTISLIRDQTRTLYTAIV